MKKIQFIIGALVAASVALSGCADSKVIGGHEVQPYGVFNQQTAKTPGVDYEVSPGSVILAIVFVETVVVPVYIVGWDLYQPVRQTPSPALPAKS